MLDAHDAAEIEMREQIAYLRAALEYIAEGRGTFSRDQLTFATNVIENLKAVAEGALAGTWEAGNDER